MHKVIVHFSDDVSFGSLGEGFEFNFSIPSPVLLACLWCSLVCKIYIVALDKTGCNILD